MRRKIGLKLVNMLLICGLLFTVSCTSEKAGGKTAERETLRFYSAGEGSMTYTSGAGLCNIIKENNPEFWSDVVTIPSAGPTAGFRGMETKETEATYTGLTQMISLWRDEDMFKDDPVDEENKALLATALWEHQSFIITLADNNEINKLSDLEGKKVGVFTPGLTTNLLALDAHEAWGYDVELVNVEVDGTADALREGIIDATWFFMHSGYATSSWVKELEIRTDVKILPMTKEEAQVVADFIPGATVSEIVLSNFTDYIQGPETFWAPSFGMFWALSPHLSEEAGYQMAIALYENADKTTEAYLGHKIFAEDPLGFNVKYFDVAAEEGIPIHPGVVRWLKENNVWKDNWIIGEITE